MRSLPKDDMRKTVRFDDFLGRFFFFFLVSAQRHLNQLHKIELHLSQRPLVDDLDAAAASTSATSAPSSGSAEPEHAARYRQLAAICKRNLSLWLQMLHYRPVSLVHTLQLVRDAGLAITLAELRAFLDHNCVAFATE